MTVETDIVRELVAEVPELQPVLDDHLAEQEGELLPYLFVGDVAQWLHERSSTDSALVGEVLARLEARYAAGDFETKNLIDVGVIEMLPPVPDGATVAGAAQDLSALLQHLRDTNELVERLHSTTEGC